MKYLKNIIYIISLVSGLASGVAGQYITASVDTTNHLIGDHIHLFVRADVENASDILGVDLSAFDTSGFELLDEGEWKAQQKAHTKYYVKDLVLTRFDSGYFRVPPVAVKVKDPDGKTLVERTPWIPVMIDVAPVHAPEPDPIKGIYEEGEYWTDYLPILYALLALLLGYGLYRWYKKRKEIEVPQETIPVIPPREEAMKALDDLERAALWEQGKLKEHYSGISEITRRFLERKYGFPALEWTKREIRRHLSKKGITGFPMGPLGEILRLTDLVKFGKYQPEATRHKQVLEETKALIQRMDHISLDPVITQNQEEEE